MRVVAVARLRRRRPIGQRVQDLLHAEVVDAGTEEYRRLPAGEELAQVERRARAAHQIDVVVQRRHFRGKELREARIVESLDQLAVVGAAFLAGREAQQPVVAQVEHAAKGLAHADRPGDRRAVDLEHRLDFLEQCHRLAHFAVHLVDERDDRRIAQPAHFEQLDRLLLDALGRVDHHHRRVHRGQHAIGVFGEILVARRVEQVDRVARVLELHHRARDRDAALLFDFHPVGRRVPRALARLDGAGHLDRAAEQQQLLGQRGLARIRVRNDGERAALGDVAHEIGREIGSVHRDENKSRRPDSAGGMVFANYSNSRCSPPPTTT